MFGDVVRLGESIYGLSKVFSEKYPKGKIVRVYYNPEDIEDSMLEPGELPNIFFVCVLVGFVILFLAIYMDKILKFFVEGVKYFDDGY